MKRIILTFQIATMVCMQSETFCAELKTQIDCLILRTRDNERVNFPAKYIKYSNLSATILECCCRLDQELPHYNYGKNRSLSINSRNKDN
jgi:hypothetical protein